jgi:hypothetical protein
MEIRTERGRQRDKAAGVARICAVILIHLPRAVPVPLFSQGDWRQHELTDASTRAKPQVASLLWIAENAGLMDLGRWRLP